MRRALAAGAAIAGLAVIGYAVLASPTDEERIRDRLDALEAAVQVDGDTSTNPVLRAGAVGGAFKEIFTEDVTFRIPELTSGDRGRPALARLAAQSGMYFSTLTVDFGGTDIELQGSATSARVTSVATVQGTRGGGRLERDDRAVTFTFTKQDGEWLISDVRVAPKE
jgi:ketosteroid isomerase-like protein